MERDTCYAFCKRQCMIEAYSDSDDVLELEQTKKWTKCPDFMHKKEVVEKKIGELGQNPSETILDY